MREKSSGLQICSQLQHRLQDRRRLLRSLATLALPRRLLHRQRPSVDVRLPASPDIGGFPPSKPFLIALPSFSSARVSAPACEPPPSPSSSPAPLSSESRDVVAPPPASAGGRRVLFAASPPRATTATLSSPWTDAPFSTPPLSPST
uniref:Uncharacterized protein n=1 Tax=Oryza sativa subsp. japonica TaxID=39947 RepID=Q6H485_ORYSJ|nr:hypothetical protein [Oryza sativa Japonica Group]BAD28771.1 hypothetical protein [Oryza sativa Japonica Group]